MLEGNEEDCVTDMLVELLWSWLSEVVDVAVYRESVSEELGWML